jgi:hypothetical protein
MVFSSKNIQTIQQLRRRQLSPLISLATCFDYSHPQASLFKTCEWCATYNAELYHTLLLPVSHTTQLQTISRCAALFPNIHDSAKEGYSNPGRQVAVATKFCTVTPNICGSSLGMCFILTLWHLRIEVASTFFENFVNPRRK